MTSFISESGTSRRFAPLESPKVGLERASSQHALGEFVTQGAFSNDFPCCTTA
jgi:hypothetical protein